MRALQLTGKIFGRLTVVESSGPMKSCVCVCGKSKMVRTSHLTLGMTRSCGCLDADAKRSRIKHGHARGAGASPEYYAWAAMKARCYSREGRNYPQYGGRGIEVCQEWLNDFSRFLADMGPRPSRLHSVERNDVDGNYEPSNCRWATASEQAKNKTSTIRVDVGGKSLCLKEACDVLGLSYKAVHLRISRYGWSIEKAMAVPIRNWGPGKKRKAA